MIAAKRWSYALLTLSLVLLCGALFPLYKGVELGITAEEGLRYSVPHVPEEKPGFEQMNALAERWMRLAEGALLLSAASGGTGWVRHKISRLKQKSTSD